MNDFKNIIFTCIFRSNFRHIHPKRIDIFRWILMTMSSFFQLTLWGRVTHICVVNLTIIGSDNGLSPGRRQTIIWINAGILLIEPLGTTFSEILIKIHTFSFKKIHLKTSSGKRRPFCLGLNVLMAQCCQVTLSHVSPGHTELTW